MEKMLDLLVRRGRFEAALEIAKRARKLSIEYRQLIGDRLLQAYRAPGSVNWSQQVAGKLNNAREHVRGRQAEDQRMEEAVRENLVKAEEPKTRQDLSVLLKTLQSAGNVRAQLVSDISTAPEKFMEAQRTVFRARRPSGMPDLEDNLFPKILGLPTGVLVEHADHCIASFYPPDWPKVFDLNSVFAMLLERRAEDVEPEVDDGEITPFVPYPDRFSEELIATVRAWLEIRFSAGASYRVDELLRLAADEGMDAEMRRCIALMLYRSFAQSETLFHNMHAEKCGRFDFDIAEGDNLIFSPLGDE
nr:hypothetical protein [Cupriavidus taiwanensis]